VTEAALLDAARGGDEAAFAQLVDAHRRELLAHCYRMLGSVHDAEDALQDALVRAWRALAGFEGRSSLKAWLYTIATNACLKAIERRPKRVLPIDYGAPGDPHDDVAAPLVESVWIEPFPDEQLRLDDGLAGPEARYEQRESVELAFVAALQLLPARQRAVLILRDVLGFSGAEVADALDTTPASVYSALQRAHKTVDERLPQQSQQATLRSVGDERLRELTAEFIAAWERGDVDGVVNLLTEDATMTMPPTPTWFRGRDAVADFLARRPLRPERRWRALPTVANAQAAVGFYQWSEDAQAYTAHGITVLTLDGGLIGDFTTFLEAKAFNAFGLPQTYEQHLRK